MDLLSHRTLLGEASEDDLLCQGGAEGAAPTQQMAEPTEQTPERGVAETPTQERWDDEEEEEEEQQQEEEEEEEEEREP